MVFISSEYWERMKNLKGMKFDPNKKCPTCGQSMPIEEYIPKGRMVFPNKEEKA